MKDPIKRAAVAWYHAEYSAGRVGMLPISDMLAMAVPRVRQVFSGEVRWSEATPGDKAVWRGRPRSIEDEHKYGESYINIYDTAVFWPKGYVFTDRPHCKPDNGMVPQRLFGNAYIGNAAFTNLQIGGVISAEDDFHANQIYVELSRELIPDEIHEIGRPGMQDHGGVVTLVVGARIAYHGTVRDLVMGAPINTVVHARENLFVEVTPYGIKAPLEVYVHLEGVLKATKGLQVGE